MPSTCLNGHCATTLCLLTYLWRISYSFNNHHHHHHFHQSQAISELELAFKALIVKSVIVIDFVLTGGLSRTGKYATKLNL